MKTILPQLTLCFFAIIILNSCSSEEDNVSIYEPVIEAKITYTPIENNILSIVNDYRFGIGLHKLNRLNIISTVAEVHSNYMAEKGVVNHDNFPERHEILVNNADAKKVGENVAFGYNSAESVVNAWLNSDGHRKIIENPDYTHFGISTKVDQNGRCYFTHIYITQ